MRLIKRLLAVIGLVGGSAVSVCAQNDGFAEAPSQTAWVDLSLDTLKMVMSVPAGTMLTNVGGLLIANDNEFAVRIEEVDPKVFKLAAMKQEAMTSGLDKFKRFIVNTDTSVFFEVYMHASRMEFPFHIIRQLNGRYYHFYNDRGAGRYSEEYATDMFNAVLGMRKK